MWNGWSRTYTRPRSRMLCYVSGGMHRHDDSTNTLRRQRCGVAEMRSTMLCDAAAMDHHLGRTLTYQHHLTCYNICTGQQHCWHWGRLEEVSPPFMCTCPGIYYRQSSDLFLYLHLQTTYIIIEAEK